MLSKHPYPAHLDDHLQRKKGEKRWKETTVTHLYQSTSQLNAHMFFKCKLFRAIKALLVALMSI